MGQISLEEISYKFT